MRSLLLIIGVALALLVAGCGSGSTSSSSTATEVTVKTDDGAPSVTLPPGPLPKQLVTEELKQGTGATAKTGDTVVVRYVGVVYQTQRELDREWRHPFTYELGSHQQLEGWEKGIPGMKVGGRRKVIVPPALAYEKLGGSPPVSPDSTLVFVFELLDIE